MEAASQVLSVGTSAAGAATGTAAGTGAVSALLTAAGASATVPIAGWIAAGVAVVAAGMISLVVGLKKGALRNVEAVAQARALGIPDAAAFPAFTKRALRWSSAKRTRKARALERRLGRRGTRRDWRWRTKLQLLGVIEAVDRAEARGQLPAVEQALRAPDSPSSQAGYRRLQTQEKRRQVALAGQGSPTSLYLALGGTTLVLAAILLSQRGEA